MKYTQLANSRILEQPIYQPGKPIELVAQEEGINPDSICKLASNENPWGASPNGLEAAHRALKNIHRYPDGGATVLKQSLAQFHGLGTEQFIIGNGSNEIIELIGHVFLQPGDEVLIGEHAFVVYKLVAMLMGASPVSVPMPSLKHNLKLFEDKITEKTKLIFIPSPNNPTGTWNTSEEIEAFVNSLPDHVIFCFDEAYAEYLEDPPDLKKFINKGKKVIGLRTFSKIYGLAGLRVGYGYGSEEVINLLQLARQPFNANSLAMASAVASLNDVSWVMDCKNKNNEGLRQLENAFDSMNLKWVPSKANFILVDVGDGQKVFQQLQKLGIIVRPMPETLGSYIRVSVGTPEENHQVITGLGKILQSQES